MARNDMGELTIRQARFVRALATARSIVDAAQVAGVSERQARRYMTMPEVRAAIEGAQDDQFREAARLASRGLLVGLSALIALADDPAQKPATRINAAKGLTGCALQLRELLVLTERVAALEKRLAGDGE